MARILVTGASGFIGAPLVTALASSGHEVVAADRSQGDVRDEAFWSRMPDCEHVIHLAGLSFVPESWMDPAAYISTNVVGAAQAVRYCRNRGKAHLLYVSAYLYGIPQRLPVHENDHVSPNNPYAFSKHLAEQACRFGAEHMDLPVTVIRPFNVFGPGQNPRFLIPEIIAQISAGHEIHVKDLAPRRDYVYVEDMVDALCLGLGKPDGYRVLNIGSGISHSVQEIIAIAQKEAGTRLPIVSDQQSRHQEIPDVRADITRAREVLGWIPRHTLAEGMAKLIAKEQVS